MVMLKKNKELYDNLYANIKDYKYENIFFKTKII